MRYSNIKTDDQSFRTFLNSICHNSLFEHASATMLYDIIIEILLRHEYLYTDCFFCLGKEMPKNHENIKDALEAELFKAGEEEVIKLMNQVFSKKMLIDTFLECTDEEAREGIIYNQNYWIENKVCGIDHHYEKYKNFGL